jgi:hypothetical protein
MKSSRTLGAVVGFGAGAAVGLGVTFSLYGANLAEPVGWLPRLGAALAVGILGALLGALFGVSRG